MLSSNSSRVEKLREYSKVMDLKLKGSEEIEVFSA